MKKLSILLLVTALLLTALLCACGDGSTTTSDTGSSATSQAQDMSSEESSEADCLVPHLGKADYSGKTLRILYSWDHITYSKAEIEPEDGNDEAVNAAFLRRNEALFEEYGFEIAGILTDGWGDFTNRVRNDLFAGTVEYDVVAMGAYYLAPLASDGNLVELTSLGDSHLRLDSEWWDVSANKYLSLGNKLYFTTGDILVLDDEFTHCLFFNKELIDAYSLESPYTLVKENRWTLDKMNEYANIVAQDKGETGMTVVDDDVWGFVGNAFDCYYLVTACNCPMIEKDNDDIPYLAMANERNADAFIKVHEMMNQKTTFAYVEQYYAWNDPNAGNVLKNFADGKALFMGENIQKVNDALLRETDVSFGIVPCPKLDDDQENYTSSIAPYNFYCIGIPDSESKDLDFITFALEAMAYTGKKYVTPEYYERTLKNKRLDDGEDSSEMLDIIMRNRVVDISVIYDWDNCIQYYNNLLVESANGIISFVEMHESAFNSAMEATLEAYGISK